MATIADELLHDFEDSADEAESNDASLDVKIGDDSQGMDIDEDDGSTTHPGSMEELLADADDDEDGDADAARARIEKMRFRGVKDIASVAGLLQTMQPVLEKISRSQQDAPDTDAVTGTVEDHPELSDLITQSNDFSAQIDNEVMLVHKFLRDHYSVRFPELELHLTNPLDYAKVVSIIGNGPMDSSSMNAFRAPLRSVLDGPSLMIIILEATRTQGTAMSESELQRVLTACQMMVSFDEARQVLTRFVQSRTRLFAPNLTALVGSVTAAQLLSAAGGLTGLSRTPACNIAAWGSKKQKNTAFATNIGIRQQGFLYHCDLVRRVPEDLKRQAMRMISAKVVLAARIDRSQNSRDESAGLEFKEACLNRLEKLELPPANKGQRALPAPDDKPSRKRGGRRARKAKEATAMTGLRKAQNRMAFGKEEKEVGYGTGDSTVGLGMIGQANDGKIRGIQVDQRTRAKLGVRNEGWGTATVVSGGSTALLAAGNPAMNLSRGLRTTGVGSMIGTASSLAFTPKQGLELVDPKIQAELSRKRKAEEDRWFQGGTFTRVASSSASLSNDGFKVPALPPSKKVDTGAGKDNSLQSR